MKTMKKGPAMWPHILLVIILIASPSIGWCETIQFPIDPAITGVLLQGVSASFDFFSSDLNGTMLTGQSLSLNLVFSNDVLARVFPPPPGSVGIVDVLLKVHTDAGAFPGFAGPTTGFLLDPNGNQFGDFQGAGRAMSDDGTFIMGLDFVVPTGLIGAGSFDISGLHVDTAFPTTGFVVTSTELSNFVLGEYVAFGTALQLQEVKVPEASSLLLLACGLVVLSGWRGRKNPRRPESN